MGKNKFKSKDEVIEFCINTLKIRGFSDKNPTEIYIKNRNLYNMIYYYKKEYGFEWYELGITYNSRFRRWKNKTEDELKEYYLTNYYGRTIKELSLLDCSFYRTLRMKNLSKKIIPDYKENNKEISKGYIKWEVEYHKEGKIKQLTKNKELSDLIGVSVTTLWRYIKELPNDLLDYRYKIILSQSSKETYSKGHGLGKLTKEDRVKMAKKNNEIYGRGYGFKKLTKEQRIEYSKKGHETFIKLYGNTKRFLTAEVIEKMRANGKKMYPKTLGKISLERKKEIGKKAYKNGLENLSHEQKVSFGYKNYEKSLGRLTREQRIEYSRKAGRRNFELNGAPSNYQSLEQRIENGKKAVERLRKNKYYFNGNYYDSKSEAICAILMEKYILEFKIIEGKTYQISKDLPIVVDFLVNNNFIEYHPILIFKSNKHGMGDFKNLDNYLEYQKIRSSLTIEEKKSYQNEVRKILAQDYYEKRRKIIDKSQYKNLELILIQNPEELYDKIITKFGTNYPSKEEFIREFNEIKRKVNKVVPKI